MATVYDCALLARAAYGEVPAPADGAFDFPVVSPDDYGSLPVVAEEVDISGLSPSASRRVRSLSLRPQGMRSLICISNLLSSRKPKTPMPP